MGQIRPPFFYTLFIKISFFLALQLTIGWSANAQEIEVPDTFLQLYQNQLPFFQELISGGEYVDFIGAVDGEPFYKSRNFDYGQLRINSIDYEGVPLLYDSYRDYLVTFHPIYKQKILLKAEKVDEFVLFEKDKFKFFPGNESFSRHNNGFYQVLHDGEIKVLVKRYKTLKETKDLRESLDQLIEKEEYFLWFEEQFEKVDKKNSAIKLLGLDRKEVKQQLNWSSYEIRQNPGGYFTSLVEVRERKSEEFNGFNR